MDSPVPSAENAFPSTCWSELVGSAADEEARRRRLDVLARRYYRPVAAWVRRRFARTDEDALDAASEFFLWVMESDLLSRADRTRGSFRGFVKRALENFLHDLERKRRTWKRGGRSRFVSMDATDDEHGLRIPDGGATPDEVLDGFWRQELLAQAADELEAELREKGKERTFALFRDYFLAGDDIDYATLAARHGVSTIDVSNALAHAKRRYRARLRAAVADTVADDDGLRAELAWLFDDPPNA